MEEHTTTSLEYLKGFNEGYTLAKEASTLADKLGQIKSNTDRIKGLHDGRRQFVLDKAQEQRKSPTLPSKSKEEKTARKDQDLDKEK